MKKTISFLFITLFLNTAVLMAQPTPASAGDGYVSGKIILADNTEITGSIKDNIRKKGEVVFLQGDKKTKYKANDISGAEIGGAQYITNNYTFYEVMWKGSNTCLLRKANTPSGVQYAGTEPIVISPGEGNIDDLFFQKGNSIQLLTKGNFKSVLSENCSSCAAGIDVSKFDNDSVKKAIAACDKCN
jgi:hypothetical protein